MTFQKQLKDKRKEKTDGFIITQHLCYTFFYRHIWKSESLGNLKNLFSYHRGKLPPAPTWLKAKAHEGEIELKRLI